MPSLLNSEILTLGIRGSLHTACRLTESVSEVDVSFSHDGLMESRKLSDHLRHGLLQQVFLFALLYVLFTETYRKKIKIWEDGHNITLCKKDSSQISWTLADEQIGRFACALENVWAHSPSLNREHTDILKQSCSCFIKYDVCYHLPQVPQMTKFNDIEHLHLNFPFLFFLNL